MVQRALSLIVVVCPFLFADAGRAEPDPSAETLLLPGARYELRLVEREDLVIPVLHVGEPGISGSAEHVPIALERFEDSQGTVARTVSRSDAPADARGFLVNRGADSAAVIPIERAPVDSADGALQFVYSSATAQDPDLGCAVEQTAVADVRPPAAAGSLRGQRRATEGWHAIDVVIVSSGDFTAGRGDSELVQEIAQVIDGANLYFEPLGIVLRLAGVQIFAPGSADPFAEATARRDAVQMLQTAQMLWNGKDLPLHNLVGVLARSGYGATNGLAFTATTCTRPERAVFFASDGGDASGAALASTVAHEIGHTLGMNHDATRYSNGPSLMWPTILQRANGFSQQSIAESEAFGAKGGDSCFEEIAPPSYARENDAQADGSLLSFAEGSLVHLTVQEGELLHFTPHLATFEPGAVFSADFLPAGAAFDAKSGTIDYTPAFSVSDTRHRLRRYATTVTASTFSASASLSVVVDVTDNNRAPYFDPPPEQPIVATEGSLLRFSVRAADPDGFDRAGITSRSFTPRLPGRPQVRCRSGRCTIAWRVPVGARGEYTFALRARDLAHRVAAAAYRISVVSANAAPVLSGLEPKTVGAGERVDLHIAAADPEGAIPKLTIDGVPAGAIVTAKDGALAIQFVAPAGSAESQPLKLTAHATDGQVSTDGTLTLTVRQGSGRTAALDWPGTPRVADAVSGYDGAAREGATVYDPATGIWSNFDCGGTKFGSAQFGGLPGDVPLAVRRHGGMVRAVYRTENGQGVWIVARQDAPDERIAWGLLRDVPVTGDFDGDGETDAVVYRPSTREWLIRTIAGVTSVEPPLEEESRALEAPFLADVDGDGRADRIVFERLPDGRIVFTAAPSSNPGAVTRFYLGTVHPADTAVPLVADIDGDGRADFIVHDGAGALTYFVSSSGSTGTAKLSATGGSLLGVARCNTDGETLFGLDPTGAHLTAFDPSSASSSTVSIEVLPTLATSLSGALLRRTRAMATASFGDVASFGATPRAVWRRDGSGGAWLVRGADGQALSFPPRAPQFSYHTAAPVDSAHRQALISFADGLWAIENRDQPARTVRWGVAGDVPVVADFNGDGISELAVFRPADSSWWIRFEGADGQGEEASVVSWGEQGDTPVAADYDGDGRADIAVWRARPGALVGQPGDGAWYIRLSTGGVRVERFGTSADVPAPADYLGLGATALAIFRPGDGLWAIRPVGSAHVVTAKWGERDDEAVRGDFDGDGRDDIAVFRPKLGLWLVLGVPESEARTQWGLPSDEPLGLLKTLRIF